MVARRLADESVQPAAFAFTAENAKWAEWKIGLYPTGPWRNCTAGRSARAQDRAAGPDRWPTGLLSAAIGLILAIARGAAHGGLVILLFGLALAVFWSGIPARRRARSALLLAPLCRAWPCCIAWSAGPLGARVNARWHSSTGKLAPERRRDQRCFAAAYGRSERVIVRCVKIGETARGSTTDRGPHRGLCRAPERCQPCAVRRLHPRQPSTLRVHPGNLAWAKATIAKYPAGKQASAVIPVLWRAQEQEGWLRAGDARGADMLGMATSASTRSRPSTRCSSLRRSARRPTCRCAARRRACCAAPRRSSRCASTASRASAAPLRRRQFLLGRGRVHRLLRQRAGRADLQGHLRGPDAAAVSSEARADGLPAGRRRRRRARETSTIPRS